MSFFSQRAIETAITEQEKFQENLGKEIIPIGLNMLALTTVTLEHTKKSEPMIVLEYHKVKDKEKYKTIKEFYFFGADAAVDKQGICISAKQLISRMKSAFNYVIKPTDDLADVVTQIMAFENTRLRAVIKHEKKLLPSLVETLSPAIAFCGLENDESINEKSYDASKLLIPLSEYDRQRLAGTAQRAKAGAAGPSAKTGGGAAAGGQNLGDAPKVSDDDDDLPF